MMTIFDKFQYIVDARREMATLGTDTVHVVMDKVISPTEAVVNGRRTILRNLRKRHAQPK